jgi:crotonobetainyl-CoA:carnitine CoA-transferase CaiB-like acyl-CoA transferase
MNVPLLHFLYSGSAPKRVGVNHATIAPYGAYQCRDGTKIIFSVQNEREWHLFCEIFLLCTALIDEPRFSQNDARVKHRAELDEIIGAVFASMTAEEAMRRLKASKLAYGRLNSIASASDHPHLRSVSQNTPAGDIRMVPPAPIVNEPAPYTLRKVPALGEHSAAIREEFSR